MEVSHYPTLDKKSREKQLFSPLSRPILSVGFYPGGPPLHPTFFQNFTTFWYLSTSMPS